MESKKPEIGQAPFDEPLTPAERKLTPEELRQKHILEQQAEQQRRFRSETKEEAATGHGRSNVKTPGKSVPPHFERGQLAHQYSDLLIPTSELPPGLRAEVTVELPGKKFRIDRVDFGNGVYYEVKPDTPLSIEKGLQQIRKYEEYMNDNYPLPDGGRWIGRVVTYSRTHAMALFGI